MYRLVCSLLLLATFLGNVYAQEPDQPQKERKYYDDHYVEYTYHDKQKQYMTVRSYYLDDVLFAEDNYISRSYNSGYELRVPQLVPHGLSRVWYRNGQIYVSREYKDGQLRGPFQVFYESGAVKRKEYYSFGRAKARKSVCFTEDGQQTPCEPFVMQASFPGGKDSLQTYLRRGILPSIPKNIETQYYTFQLTINEIGQVVKVQTRTPSSVLLARVYQVLRDMPNWKPATVDGVPFLTQQTVNLMLTRKTVYLYTPSSTPRRTRMTDQRWMPNNTGPSINSGFRMPQNLSW